LKKRGFFASSALTTIGLFTLILYYSRVGSLPIELLYLYQLFIVPAVILLSSGPLTVFRKLESVGVLLVHLVVGWILWGVFAVSSAFAVDARSISFVTYLALLLGHILLCFSVGLVHSHIHKRGSAQAQQAREKVGKYEAVLARRQAISLHTAVGHHHIVCPNCMGASTYLFSASVETLPCSNCQQVFTSYATYIRAKRGSSDSRTGVRTYRVRVRDSSGSEELIVFNDTQHKDIELRAGDEVIFSYLDNVLRIVQNITIGCHYQFVVEQNYTKTIVAIFVVLVLGCFASITLLMLLIGIVRSLSVT
jgi:hypothetical protein